MIDISEHTVEKGENMKRVYLDYVATTPTDPEVVKAMLPYFGEIYGNPSSLHSFGEEANRATEAVRADIASFLGAKPEEVIDQRNWPTGVWHLSAKNRQHGSRLKHR
jgi:selenocysteine lyase/cysteine desulfurase